MIVSVGLSLIFIPITAASYDGLPQEKADMASASLNAARNTGGSIGVSLASNVRYPENLVAPLKAVRKNPRP
jgi:DHA2 family multidrug resistance protein